MKIRKPLIYEFSQAEISSGSANNLNRHEYVLNTDTQEMLQGNPSGLPQVSGGSVVGGRAIQNITAAGTAIAEDSSGKALHVVVSGSGTITTVTKNHVTLPSVGVTKDIVISNKKTSKLTVSFNTTDFPAVNESEGVSDYDVVINKGTTVRVYFTGLTAATAEVYSEVADDLATQAELDAHTSNTANPHGVTKTQVGLDKVDNVSDAEKPLSDTEQRTLTKSTNPSSKVVAHPINFASATATDTDGTHTVTHSSAYPGGFDGWKAFDNTDSSDWATQAITSNFWVAIQLPIKKIITRIIVRGRNSGTERITSWKIEGSNDGTNWDTLYSSTTALGNTAQTFDFTNNKAYNRYRLFAVSAETTNPGLSRLEFHEQEYAALAHSHTKADVGLGNVDNTSDANKPVSTATQTALDAKAPLASPTFTGTPVAPTAAAGTNTTQVATTAFVGDAVASLQAGLDFKNSVKAATTANITLSGTQTIDGVSLVAGDRVLVKNQATGSQNGLYDVAAGAWARSTDANANNEVSAGMAVFVEGGTTHGQQLWYLVTQNVTLGTTALVFARFADTSGLESLSNKVTAFSSPTDTQYPSAKLVNDQLATKQATLVNQTNIKSVNGSSLLGSGDLSVSAQGVTVSNKVAHLENFTANTNGSYTVSASSEFSSAFQAHEAFDSDAGSDWATQGVTSNFWIKIQLPTARAIHRFVAKGRGSAEHMTNWQFEGSNDNTNWTTLDSATVTIDKTTGVDRTFTNTTKYLYYRLFAISGSGTNPGLSELRLFGKEYSFDNFTV